MCSIIDVDLHCGMENAQAWNNVLKCSKTKWANWTSHQCILNWSQMHGVIMPKLFQHPKLWSVPPKKNVKSKIQGYWQRTESFKCVIAMDQGRLTQLDMTTSKFFTASFHKAWQVLPFVSTHGHCQKSWGISEGNYVKRLCKWDTIQNLQQLCLLRCEHSPMLLVSHQISTTENLTELSKNTVELVKPSSQAHWKPKRQPIATD